jgi:hypothetical protein
VGKEQSMSYESKMLEQLAMPTRKEVEQALLRTLLKHDGVIKEFGSGEEIVDEIAGLFGLNESQRSAFLETIYRKENRIKKAFLWHRLLFRAADYLAKRNMVSRPTQTLQLTKKREWMLTEKGFDKALKLCNIPTSEKERLPTKSFEVQKIVKRLIESPKPENYDPFDKDKKIVKTTRASALRNRAFRQAVLEAYNYKCAVCGLKIKSPDSLLWEVEAAHIVPHRSFGRDDVCNGIGLCHLHHWAFDVGWFTVLDDYKVQISPHIDRLPADCGKIESYQFFQAIADGRVRLCLPKRNEIYPHHNAIRWHRENIFYKQCL